MSNPLVKHYESDLEVIELHGCKFHIKLPTITNKRFQRAVMSKVAKRNDNGEFSTDEITIEEMADAQVDAFVHHCIRKVEGWPDYNADSLLRETPEAADELFEKAAELVDKAQAEADASVGKSQAGSPGTNDGVEKPDSPQNLQSAVG